MRTTLIAPVYGLPKPLEYSLARLIVDSGFVLARIIPRRSVTGCWAMILMSIKKDFACTFSHPPPTMFIQYLTITMDDGGNGTFHCAQSSSQVRSS